MDARILHAGTAASIHPTSGLSARRGHSVDRRGQLPTDIELVFPECIESLRCDLARQASELFQLCLFHALSHAHNLDRGLYPRSGQAAFRQAGFLLPPDNVGFYAARRCRAAAVIIAARFFGDHHPSAHWCWSS
jgi:hypothetical protein